MCRKKVSTCSVWVAAPVAPRIGGAFGSRGWPEAWTAACKNNTLLGACFFSHAHIGNLRVSTAHGHVRNYGARSMCNCLCAGAREWVCMHVIAVSLLKCGGLFFVQLRVHGRVSICLKRPCAAIFSNIMHYNAAQGNCLRARKPQGSLSGLK